MNNIMAGGICAVYNCNNYSVLNCSKTFFRFPKDNATCQKWVYNCWREDLDKIFKQHGPEYLYRNYRICSDHFTSTSFRNPNLASQGLLPGSLPSENLPKNNFATMCSGGLKKRGREDCYNTATSRHQIGGPLPDSSVPRHSREEPGQEINRFKKQLEQQQKEVGRLRQQMQKMRREMPQLKYARDLKKDGNILQACGVSRGRGRTRGRGHGRSRGRP